MNILLHGKVKERLDNFDPSVFPYTFIKCKQGFTFIVAYNDEAFSTLMEIIGRPGLAEDPRFSSFRNRATRYLSSGFSGPFEEAL
ncbi:MAG: CoA transferase, partial [Desulfobacterales bacterium]